jgi:hypothetical protein
MVVPMGEKIEGDMLGAPTVDMALPGKAMASQTETIVSEAPMTDVARPGTTLMA